MTFEGSSAEGTQVVDMLKGAAHFFSRTGDGRLDVIVTNFCGCCRKVACTSVCVHDANEAFDIVDCNKRHHDIFHIV